MSRCSRRGQPTLAVGLRGLKDVVCAEPNRPPARRGLARRGVRLVPSNQFLTGPEDFAGWARGRRRLVMEDFYRWQRVAAARERVLFRALLCAPLNLGVLRPMDVVRPAESADVPPPEQGGLHPPGARLA
jgi:deoxyribodipyrimidine photolyase-like uncharacterized protein